MDEWWKHLDHELGQLIELHCAVGDEGFADLPELVRRSMDIAYGAAFRAVLEFIHSGQPGSEDWARLPAEPQEDIRADVLLGESLRTVWSEAELRRLRDADKLIGHLSAGRVAREGASREWGDEADLELWRGAVAQLVRDHGQHLPRAAAAWTRAQEGDSSFPFGGGGAKDVPSGEVPVVGAEVFLFWSKGNRRSEAFRYGEAMAARHGAETAEGLQYVQHFSKGDFTLAAVVGEEWRQFLLRKPDWKEVTDGDLPFRDKSED